jgi:hypothetical protein
MWWLLLALIPVVLYVAMNYSSIQVAKPCGSCSKKAEEIV